MLNYGKTELLQPLPQETEENHQKSVRLVSSSPGLKPGTSQMQIWHVSILASNSVGESSCSSLWFSIYPINAQLYLPFCLFYSDFFLMPDHMNIKMCPPPFHSYVT